jgi:hypothetical protein
MKKHTILGYGLGLFCITVLAITGNAQRGNETITGTVLSYGSGFNTRTVTAPFTLRITHLTPPDEAQRYLTTLQQGGQDDLMNAIKNQNAGTFSVGGNLARTLNVVTERMVGGKRHLYIVFERWTRFAELRGGYRSLDYPFGYMEIEVDPSSGKGEGTYIAAAQIRWKRNKEGNNSHVEVEDFATFPARLLNVRTQRRSS